MAVRLLLLAGLLLAGCTAGPPPGAAPDDSTAPGTVPMRGIDHDWPTVEGEPPRTDLFLGLRGARTDAWDGARREECATGASQPPRIAQYGWPDLDQFQTYIELRYGLDMQVQREAPQERRGGGNVTIGAGPFVSGEGRPLLFLSIEDGAGRPAWPWMLEEARAIAEELLPAVDATWYISTRDLPPGGEERSPAAFLVQHTGLEGQLHAMLASLRPTGDKYWSLQLQAPVPEWPPGALSHDEARQLAYRFFRCMDPHEERFHAPEGAASMTPTWVAPPEGEPIMMKVADEPVPNPWGGSGNEVLIDPWSRQVLQAASWAVF